MEAIGFSDPLRQVAQETEWGTRVTKDVRTASNMIRTKNKAAWRNRVHRKRASTISELREIDENTAPRRQAQDAMKTIHKVKRNSWKLKISS